MSDGYYFFHQWGQWLALVVTWLYQHYSAAPDEWWTSSLGQWHPVFKHSVTWLSNCSTRRGWWVNSRKAWYRNSGDDNCWHSALSCIQDLKQFDHDMNNVKFWTPFQVYTPIIGTMGTLHTGELLITAVRCSVQLNLSVIQNASMLKITKSGYHPLSVFYRQCLEFELCTVYLFIIIIRFNTYVTDHTNNLRPVEKSQYILCNLMLKLACLLDSGT